MADSDFSVRAIISAQTSQFEKGMKDAQKSLEKTSQSVKTFSSELQGLTKTLGALFVGREIINFGKKSINLLEQERKETALLGKTLQTTGAIAWKTQDSLVSMSKEFEKNSNYTQESIMRAETVMLGFKSVTGEVFDSAIQNVIDMSEVMGIDLVNSVQTIGKALDDPIKGLGSLSRQGFVFSEQQKKMLEDLVATGKKAEAQKIILDELTSTYGGAGKAGQDAFKRLNIEIGNFQKILASNLVPIVNNVSTSIAGLLENFNSLDKGTQTFILTASGLTTALPMVIKGIQGLKAALVSLQTSVPVLLAISGGIIAISSAVAYISKKKNEFSDLSKEINNINKTTNTYLDTYAQGNESKKLDEEATQELIKLYPELTGKINAFSTSVADARNEVQELINKKLLDAQSSGIQDYIDRLNEIQKLREKAAKYEKTNNEMDVARAKEIRTKDIPALQELADAQREEINERLKGIGKILEYNGKIAEIPVEIKPTIKTDVDFDQKKRWQETLAEVFNIDIKSFSTGRQAVENYLNNMADVMREDQSIQSALGEVFNVSDILAQQQEKIKESINAILADVNIDEPFSVEDFSKLNSTLSSLAEKYKEIGNQIKTLKVEDEIKDLEKQVSKLGKSEIELYKAELKANGATDEQIKKAVELKSKLVEANTKVNNSAKSISEAFSDLKEKWKKDAEDWSDVVESTANTMGEAFGDTFEQIGEDLVDGGFSFEDYSATAVKAISQVLVALSAQITALGVTHALAMDFAGAALAAAGAAAALVAAGTLAAVATNMTKTAEAAKDASTSIDTFVKSLREIWSGTVTSGSFVTSLTTMKVTVTELRDSIESTTESLEEQETILERLSSIKGMKTTDEWKQYITARNNVSQLSKELEDLNTKLLLAQGELNNARMHTIENQEKEIEFAKAEISVFEELYNSLKKIPKAIYGDVKYALQQNFDILKNEQKKSLLDVQKSLYTEMSNMGKDLGKTLVDGIKNGTKTADFMESIKDYIRNKIIELTVYTESFNDKLAEIGAKLSSAIASGMTSEVKKLSGDIENLYKESTETARKAVEAMGLSLKEEVKNSSNNNDVKKEFSAEGTTLGETFITSLINGAKKEDFSKTLGSYMKEQLIRATVYTDAFKEQMDVFGKKLVSSAGNESVIKDLKKDIESLFSDKSKSIQNMTSYIDTLFNLGEVATETESKFKIAMKSFKDSIIDLGGDVANNFVSSLSGGLNVDSALLGFKKFLRDYIIKAYVFTDSMKSEIEKIGSLIGKTLDGSISKDELSNVANWVKATYGKLADSMKTVDTMLDSIFGKEVVKSVSKIQKAIDSLKDSLADLGGDVASNFISSLNSGLDLDSALISFKKFIRNYVIQSAVYTNSLKSEMEKIGQGIADYIMGKNGGLDKISNEFKKTYEKLAGNISKADEYLDKIFGKEKEKEVKDTGNTITKELSKIESAMDSFKKTVSDLGGDIASNLIDGLSNGLSQSDFLSNMKDWLRKMLVQSVVYTETLKTEIEEIGKRISEGITTGFTDTSLHEIRRDLSYIFESTSSKMSNIDNILSGVFSGYASGTESATRGLHIVGEAGPELVRFRGGERVYNNRDTMGIISGNKTNNFNVTFNNMLDTSAFAMMNQLKRYNKEMAINGVL